MARQPNRDRRQTNGWDVLLHFVNRAFNSGYALAVIGGLFSLGFLWIVVQKLDSKDLKDLIEGALTTWISTLGWLLFFIGSVIYLTAYRWTKARDDAEIERQRKIIDDLLPPDKKDQLKLE
jgi:hypothetical protein